MMQKWFVGAAAVLVALFAGFWGLYWLSVAGRPEQPVPFGTVLWLDECGFTVDGVTRTRTIALGAERKTASGTFYIVDARVLCPFGYRGIWDDAEAVRVQTFSGRNGTMHDASWGVDEGAQRLVDRQSGRPGPHHMIRGASQRERLVFDLPTGVEQPGLLFIPTLDRLQMVEALFGHIWEPHRFNLRYD